MRKNGFTLIELLVVIAIIAILAAILFPVFSAAKQKAKESMCVSNCRQIGTAMMSYASDWNNWIPKSSWNDWWDAPRPSEPCPYSGYEMLLMRYVKNWKVFQCPVQSKVSISGTGPLEPYKPLTSQAHKGFVSYGYNEAIVYPDPTTGLLNDRRSLSDFPAPSQTIWLAENDWGWHDTWDGKPEGLLPGFRIDNNLSRERHGSMSAYIFCDGHAAILKWERTRSPHNLWSIRPGD